MAETKYDLMLVKTKTDKKAYEQPWYKERLRTSYIKSLGPNATTGFLKSNDWNFVKDGLDDFRDGLPPVVDGSEIITGYNKGPQPNVAGSSHNLSSVKQPAAPKRFTKEQVCYARVAPQQQDRRDHIDDIEFGLKQHPLALYPHLEESVPPEVFEDVFDILDPELNLGSDEEEDGEDEEIDGEAEEEQPQASRPASSEAAEKQGEAPPKPSKNPYKWLPKIDENAKKEGKKDRRSPSLDQDSHIRQVAKGFCDWVSELGGETNNIEETTVMSLFASGYETKPALSVPIQVVEMSNVPPELQMAANARPTSAPPRDHIPQRSPEKKQWSFSGGYKPSWVKQRYGAWYLPPKTWCKMPADEPLQDPKNLKDLETSETKARSNNLDNQLASIHGVKAFMDFIDKKTYRKPEFLNRVANMDVKESNEKHENLQTRKKGRK